MTNQELSELQRQLFHDILEVTRTKGKEYGAAQDQLANFKDPDLGMDPKVVCGVYLKKHLRAIYNYIQTGQSHSTETIHGRILDAMTYLTLLDAIIREEEVDDGRAEAKGV